ncbi:LysR family transcriptional regulator [Aliikangiella sp. G2MR2-5]|uniref:LysR family transcriptional regulator n=1 Tax=Aliikangiella sp. G2MR2-5 TaxID=2788943 RepID=UPI0018ABBC18|nr:LysR family transcriptional regulator [Aliikangiella sp. G2MR2-5]
MDLRELRYFESTYELESISAAAKHCFVSQPSISAAIQNLEYYLGEQLFVRHTRGVTPTDAGHRLYPLSKQLTGQARSIKQIFQQKAAIQPFRLGVVPALGAVRMSHLIKEIIDSVDGLELTLVDAEKLACEARIIAANMVKPGEIFMPFWRDEFLMALPPGHSLSYKSELELEDLNGLNFILRSPSLVTRTLMRKMEPKDIKMNIRARIRTVEYAVELVAAGVGAAVVPDHPSFYNTQQLPLVKIKGMQFDRIIGLAWSREAEMDKALSSVIDVCRVNKIEHFDLSPYEIS